MITETEPDVIARILGEHHSRDSSHIAQRSHTALIERRYRMLSEDLQRRRAEGLA